MRAGRRRRPAVGRFEVYGRVARLGGIDARQRPRADAPADGAHDGGDRQVRRHSVDEFDDRQS